MLDKKEEISMSNGEEMKIAVLLSMHCFEKNAGNRIKLGLKNSKNASWRGLLGLPHKKYEKLIEKGATGLWHCEGDDIIVDLYSVEMEARRHARRDIAFGASRAAAEARKERASQRGENLTADTMMDTMMDANIEKNKNKNKEKMVVEGERETEAEQEEEADREAKGAHPRASGIDEAPDSSYEILSFLKAKYPRLAKDYPDLFNSIADEFFESSDLCRCGTWKDDAMKFLNQRLVNTNLNKH